MQNINGQWVDVDAIESNRNYYDRDFDASDWCFDVEEDEDFTIEIRKAQYDYMIDGMYTLKQQYTWARRMADNRMNEIIDLKEQVLELQTALLDGHYMSTWFDCLVKNGDIKAYEEDGLLSYSALPFYQDKVDDLIDKGISMTVIQDYARKKYQEWKANKEKEGEEIEEA